MKLLDLISSSDHLKWVQGVEANLLQRRQIGNQGGITVMILGGLLQIWIFLFGEMSAEKVLGNLSGFRAGKLDEFEKKLQAEEKLTDSKRVHIRIRYSANYEPNTG